MTQKFRAYFKGRYSIRRHVSKEAVVLSGYSVKFDDNGNEVKE